MPTQQTNQEIISKGELLFTEALELAERNSLLQEKIDRNNLRIEEINREAEELARPKELAEVQALPALPVGEPAPTRGALIGSAETAGTPVRFRVEKSATDTAPFLKKSMADILASSTPEEGEVIKQGARYLHHLRLN